MSTSGKRGRGRPAKGDRHKRTVRFRLVVDTALQRAAAAEGKTVQDYLEALVEENVSSFMPTEDPEEEHLMTA